MDELLRKIKTINNRGKDIGWGSNEIPVTTDDAVRKFILVVGHKRYRKIITLYLEKLKVNTYRLSLAGESDQTEIVTDNCDKERLKQTVIDHLKIWFPETTRTQIQTKTLTEDNNV